MMYLADISDLFPLVYVGWIAVNVGTYIHGAQVMN